MNQINFTLLPKRINSPISIDITGTDDASNCSILNESSYFDETDLSMNGIFLP